MSTDSRFIILIDPLINDGEARPLDDVLRLDVRTRLLNPKWYEAMLKHGYQGVSEIAARLDHVFGWSATTDRVDDWVYEAAADTFLLDERMLERLRRLNPQAVRRMTARILEADARGFWQADPIDGSDSNVGRRTRRSCRRAGISRRRRMDDMFPFSAIVGQEELKRALILHAIDPGIGGVVILGDRGTGKSTAVRALARLLPVHSCRRRLPFPLRSGPTYGWCSECREKFNAATPLPTVECAIPVVDLPLGVSEDRLLGSLDIEAALAEARKVFSPGLLAEAHRGFLYIDEVNLLEDHLVDLLLDAAASGVNVVEREGISLQHPARFVLIGSGNPEEGDLRPQLRDRFALCVEVTRRKTLPSEPKSCGGV